MKSKTKPSHKRLGETSSGFNTSRKLRPELGSKSGHSTIVYDKVPDKVFRDGHNRVFQALLFRLRQISAALLLVGCLENFPLLKAEPADPGWPRVFKKDGAHLTVYQPQVDYWNGYTNSAQSKARS